MILTNRAAITVKVTQAFIDWFNEVDPNKNHKDYRPMVWDADSEGTVYLIPEWDSLEECEAMLRDNYQVIFEQQLAGWYS